MDDLLGIGSKANIKLYKEMINNRMECEDAGALNEHIGCKIDQDVEGRSVKLTQPVLIQSFQEKLELPGWDFIIPAPAGEELAGDDDSDPLPPVGQTKYRSGVGKLLHLSKWSRVGILIWTRELAKFMTNP